MFAQASLNPTPFSNNRTDGFPNAARCNVLQGGHDSSQCFNARYPIVHLNAMHPGEDVDLESEGGLLAIARQTVASINTINDYSPTNGICMAWPPAARVVANTSTLFAAFDQALRDTMQPNFIPFILNRPTGGSGCNMENSGATVAVNDVLVTRNKNEAKEEKEEEEEERRRKKKKEEERRRKKKKKQRGLTLILALLQASVHGHNPEVLRVLPGGWAPGQSVAFRNIRIKGAFLVSCNATADR